MLLKVRVRIYALRLVAEMTLLQAKSQDANDWSYDLSEIVDCG